MISKKYVTASGAIRAGMTGSVGLLSLRGREGPSDAVMFGQRQASRKTVCAWLGESHLYLAK